MIAEVGIMVGCYILTRLVPGSWRKARALASFVAAAVALMVIADLTLRSVSHRDLAAMVDILASPSEGPAPTPTSAPLVTTPSRPATTSITRADGGSITTELGYGIALAKNSSLRREWIAIHDSALPVDIEGTPGVDTVYISERYRGDYRYQTRFKVKTTAPISALEMRFLTFNVWGAHVRTLAMSEVQDLPADDTREFKGEWELYAESEAEQHYASIAFVARVRLADGRVVEADYLPIVLEAQKFSAKFSTADLEAQSNAPPHTPAPGPTS